MRSEAEIQAEIARLSAALEVKPAPPAPAPAPSYRGRGGASHYRGAWVPPPARGRGRGGYRGRGGHQPAPFRNQTLVLNGASTTAPATTSIVAVASTSSDTPAPTPTTTSRSLPGGGKEVTIDGVIFLSDASGRKLVRKGADAMPATSSSAASTTATDSTPKSAVVAGTTYVRTKSGNLVSSELVKKRRKLAEKRALEEKRRRLEKTVNVLKRQQAARDGGGKGPRAVKKRGDPTKLCKFFTRTGTCKNGLTCAFIHDSAKVAICPRFLRGNCPNKASDCPLSHTKSAHNLPHCSYLPNCRSGASCSYSHAAVPPEAPLCDDFAECGWCDKGADCGKRHGWECPEFAEKGTCSRANCKLSHVLRRKPTEADQEADQHVDEPPHELDDEGEPTTTGKGKRKAEEDWLGISGAAGERYKKFKTEAHRQRKKDAVNQNADFIGLDVDSSDEEDGDSDDFDDTSSIDSDELHDPEEEDPDEDAVAQEGDPSGEEQAEPKAVTSDSV